MWWKIAQRAVRGMSSGRQPSGPRVPGASRPQRIAQQESPAVQRLQALYDAARNPTPANVVKLAQREVRQQRNVFTQARARQQAEQVYMPGQRSPTEGPWGIGARDVTPRVSPAQRGNAPRAGYDQRLAARQRRFEKTEAAREARRVDLELAEYQRKQVDAATEEFFFPTPTSPVTAAIKAASPAGRSQVETNVETTTVPEGHSVRTVGNTKCKERPSDNRSRGGSSKRWVPWCEV